MVGRLDREYVDRLPVPALFARLRRIRQIDARRRLDALHDQICATRGKAEDVQSLTDALCEAAGVEQAAGSVDDLMRALGGQ